MKTIKLNAYPYILLFAFFGYFGYLSSCTNEDQIIEPVNAGNVESQLISGKVTTPPTIDGTVDAAWDKATKLNFTATVPDPGNNLFTGYVNQTYSGTMRSLYDNEYLYFLVEIKDNTKNVKSAPWYFNPATKRWAQEPTAKTFDASGILTREGWGEDKLAFLWNIDKSTPKFLSQTCYASCHIFTPYIDYSLTSPAPKSNASSGNHYTNGASEKIDMWWAHPNRGLIFNQLDDNYQDWAGGPGVTGLVGGSGNGRHFDDLVVSGASSTWPFAPTYTSDATQGSINNRQSLKLDGTGATVTVPLWIVPNSTSDFIKASDTLAGGPAVRILSVSSTGVLGYESGSVDPNVGTDYQRTGDAVTGNTAIKSFPGVIVSPVLRGRADINLTAIHSGTTWVYEFRRLLKTADVLKQDIDFTKDKVGDQLQDQPFGVAIWDRSNYQHGIKPNLLLKFK